MQRMQLVIAGTVGAGKTTFIRTISEIEAVNTDRKPTDEIAELKPSTTVAMDFGCFTFGNTLTLHLYGTPGQERFDFMWELLIKRAHAYILLVAAHRPEEFLQARQILAFINQRTTIPMLVGVSHTDRPEARSVEDVGLAMGCGDESRSFPVIAVNPTNKQSVLQALITLVKHCIACSTAV
jgi:small GTP-binding protein